MVGFVVVVVGGLLGAALLLVAMAYVNTAYQRSRVRSRVEDLGTAAARRGWTYRTRAWVLSGHPWTGHAAEDAGVDGDRDVDHVLETTRRGHRVVLAERQRREGDSSYTEVHGRLDMPLRGPIVELNPAQRTPSRRVHLLDDELDARWWVESGDAAGADELLLGAHDLLRRATLPSAWRVTIGHGGPRVQWRGELTGHAADGVADLLAGLAEAVPASRLRSAGTRS
jgi:hypothetical protein